MNVNGLSVQGLSHGEAIAIFKNIKVGIVRVTVSRRDRDSQQKRSVSHSEREDIKRTIQKGGEA